MAVKTNFSTKEFKEIISGYNLGEFLCASPIIAGAVQTNYLVKTSNVISVFRYYENRSRESVSFETNLIEYLRDRNYPCPALFKNKHGQSMGIYKNKPFVIFEFIEGEHLENPNEDQRKQLIQRVAEMHKITKNYRPSSKINRLNYNIESCKKLAQEKSDKINTLNSTEKLKWYTNQLSSLILPKSLPKGVCHCDFHFSNVLYKNGKFNALIDFDDANYTFLIFDLVSLLEPFKSSFDWNTWDKFEMDDEVFDFKEAKKIVSEYAKYRPLNNNEKTHMFDVLKFSILIDCIWYFERGDAKDFFEKRKIDYLDKLGRQNFYKGLF